MKISRILTGLLPAAALLLTMSRPVVKAADDVPAVGAQAPDFTLSLARTFRPAWQQVS